MCCRGGEDSKNTSLCGSFILGSFWVELISAGSHLVFDGEEEPATRVTARSPSSAACGVRFSLRSGSRSRSGE